MKIISTFLTVCGLVAAQASQAPNPVQQSTENAARMAAGAMPIYRVTVTARTTKAINYQHRSGATKIDFRGTELLPDGPRRGQSGEQAGLHRDRSGIRRTCSRPPSNGAEYLTYVLWAITPEGRTANLGEILLNGTKSKLNVTTELQVVRPGGHRGTVLRGHAAQRRDRDGKRGARGHEGEDRGDRRQVRTACSGVSISVCANPAGAEARSEAAAGTLRSAQRRSDRARRSARTVSPPRPSRRPRRAWRRPRAYQARKAGRKPVTMTAREAVQMAEDSRAIAVKTSGGRTRWPASASSRRTAKHARRADGLPRSPRRIASHAKPKRRGCRRRRKRIA